MYGFRPNLSLTGAKPRIGSEDRDSAIIGSLQNLSLEGLGPQWIRPVPPMLPVLDGEVRFHSRAYYSIF